MDKLTVISGILFITAEVFAVASLAHPDWINTGPDAGQYQLVLFYNKKALQKSVI